MSFVSGLEKWPELDETAETKVCIVRQQCLRTTCAVNVSSLFYYFFLKHDVESERFRWFSTLKLDERMKDLEV